MIIDGELAFIKFNKMSTDTVPKGVALPLETWIEELGLFEVLRREWKIKEVTEKAKN